MSKALRVLLLEDSEADADLIDEALQRSAMRAIVERVDSKEGFVAALRDFTPAVVLSDHSLASFNAPAALELLRNTRPGVPLIVVSGALDENIAVACLRAGAADVVLKNNLKRLPGAITAALAARRGLTKLTPRQLQVLRMVALGETTPGIAKRLRLSVKTVETHRSDLMKRLEIHDVVRLVRYAVRVGIVSVDA